jgi:predicted metal-binding membrane protein
VVLSAALLLASIAVTVRWCASMAAMGEWPMPGHWSLSMMWMPMCGQAWPQVAASFLGMWIAMMLAMMLPALLPTLWRYRQASLLAGARCPGWLATQMGAGYFLVWTVAGVAAFAWGATLATVVMRLSVLARAAPLAGAIVILGAGVFQCSAWKARHLRRCRERFERHAGWLLSSGVAWRSGLRLGIQCSASCAGLMAILLVVGVMDPVAMAAVTAAISAERFAPARLRVERVQGVNIVAAGLVLAARAAGPG